MTNKQDIPPAWAAAAGDVIEHISPGAILSPDYVDRRNMVAARMLQAAQAHDAQLSSDPDITISDKIRRRFERTWKSRKPQQKTSSLCLRILSFVLLPPAWVLVCLLVLLALPALIAIVLLDDDFLP